jgi:hypothetical protein
MPPLMKVLLAAMAIAAAIELVRGRSLVPWRRLQEHPLKTRGIALSLLLLVASIVASSELHAFTLAYVLDLLMLVVLLGAIIVESRERRF